MEHLRGLYKSKVQFGKVIEDRRKNVAQGQKLKREATFLRQRHRSIAAEQELAGEAGAGASNNAPQPAVRRDPRLEKLLKWKAEKNKLLEQQAVKKKPPFKAGVYHPPLNPNSVDLGAKLSVVKCSTQKKAAAAGRAQRVKHADQPKSSAAAALAALSAPQDTGRVTRSRAAAAAAASKAASSSSVSVHKQQPTASSSNVAVRKQQPAASTSSVKTRQAVNSKLKVPTKFAVDTTFKPISRSTKITSEVPNSRRNLPVREHSFAPDNYKFKAPSSLTFPTTPLALKRKQHLKSNFAVSPGFDVLAPSPNAQSQLNPKASTSRKSLRLGSLTEKVGFAVNKTPKQGRSRTRGLVNEKAGECSTSSECAGPCTPARALRSRATTSMKTREGVHASELAGNSRDIPEPFSTKSGKNPALAKSGSSKRLSNRQITTEFQTSPLQERSRDMEKLSSPSTSTFYVQETEAVLKSPRPRRSCVPIPKITSHLEQEMQSTAVERSVAENSLVESSALCQSAAPGLNKSQSLAAVAVHQTIKFFEVLHKKESSSKGELVRHHVPTVSQSTVSSSLVNGRSSESVSETPGSPSKPLQTIGSQGKGKLVRHHVPTVSQSPVSSSLVNGRSSESLSETLGSPSKPLQTIGSQGKGKLVRHHVPTVSQSTVSSSLVNGRSSESVSETPGSSSKPLQTMGSQGKRKLVRHHVRSSSPGLMLSAASNSCASPKASASKAATPRNLNNTIEVSGKKTPTRDRKSKLVRHYVPSPTSAPLLNDGKPQFGSSEKENVPCVDTVGDFSHKSESMDSPSDPLDIVQAKASRMSIHEPSPPISTPQKLPEGMVPAQFSPYITTARGKNRQSFRRESLNAPETSFVPESILKSKQIEGFRKLVERETNHLLELCDEWEGYRDEAPPSAQEHILSAVGQARLLTRDKFVQFKNLVSKFESGESEDNMTADDLTGFWEMIMVTVEDLKHRFSKLVQLKANCWKEAEIKRPVEKRPKVAVSKSLKPGGKQSSQTVTGSRPRLKDLIKAEREKKRLANQGSSTTEKVAFNGGFFKIESPQKTVTLPGTSEKSTSARNSITPLSLTRRSLLQQVLNNSAARALNESVRSPASPTVKGVVAQMRASMRGRRLSSPGDFPTLTPPSVINSLPPKSILKSRLRRSVSVNDSAPRNKVAFQVSPNPVSPLAPNNTVTPPNSVASFEPGRKTPGRKTPGVVTTKSRRQSLIPRPTNTPSSSIPVLTSQTASDCGRVSLMPMGVSFEPSQPFPNGELIDWNTPPSTKTC